MIERKPFWSIRGILPFFSIAFFNAFTDLGHKIVIQNTLVKTMSGTELVVWSSFIQALILLPFVMLFTPSGFLSDKFAKDKIIRWSAFAAIPISILILVSYQQGWFWAAFWLTFALAIQATIYSPAKYGFVKELVGKEHLATANSVIQALTIVAILGGTAVYTFVFEKFLTKPFQTAHDILPQVQIAGYLLIASCTIEWLLSLRIPRLGKTDTNLRFRVGHYLSTGYLRENLKDAWSNQAIRQSIIGLSLFFAVNQVLLASFGAYYKEVTGLDNTNIINGVLAIAGIGIVIGSTYAARMSRNFIETGLIPMGAAGMTACLFVLPHLHHNIAFAILFLIFGFFGGAFIVPLNALVQFHSKENTAGHIIASNNFVQSATMLFFLGATILLSKLGLSQRTLFVLLGVIALFGSLWAVRIMPQSLLRQVVRAFLSGRYGLQVRGLDHVPSEGGVLFLGNHISWVDWAFLQMACPRPIRFVMFRAYYEKWYLKWLLDRIGIIPISSGGSAAALAAVKEALAKGDAVALFPEGHISRNGQLSTFRSGFERAATGTGARIVPFYLQGLWGSMYSFAAGKFRDTTRSEGISRLVTVAFGPSMDDTTSATEVKRRVQELSIDAWETHIRTMRPVASAWLRTSKRMGSAPVILGHDGVHFSGYRFIAAVLSFATKVAKLTKGQQRVGLILPASGGGAIANMAVLSQGKTVVNLNYTAPAAVIAACAKKAGIKTILTSKNFRDKLKGKGFDLESLSQEFHLVNLEEIKETISKAALIQNLCKAIFFPAFLIEWTSFRKVHLDDTAAILFSSGSEGTPKGVELSHFNMVGNIKQVVSLVNPETSDIMLGNLPIFHAFGLTITTLMPLVEGIPVVTQPDPTDAKGVGKLCAEHRVTILCGTSTFLRIYAQSKSVHPLMFRHMRLVVAGAEKLRPEVRSAFREKFGLEIYEGFGTTETTPVASVNIPDTLLDDYTSVQVGNRPGTVGLPLPGSTFRIVDPETLVELPVGEAGLVLIGGSQIMKGYLDDPERTSSALALIDGKRWYRTGDKGKIDADGFLTIVDRYSRFAKLGGEMISLGQVELAIAQSNALEGIEFLATSVPDPGKGEKVAMLYTGPLEADAIIEKIRAAGIPPLLQPSLWLKQTELPRLGTGKADYSKAKEIARNAVAA